MITEITMYGVQCMCRISPDSVQVLQVLARVPETTLKEALATALNISGEPPVLIALNHAVGRFFVISQDGAGAILSGENLTMSPILFVETPGARIRRHIAERTGNSASIRATFAAPAGSHMDDAKYDGPPGG